MPATVKNSKSYISKKELMLEIITLRALLYTQKAKELSDKEIACVTSKLYEYCDNHRQHKSNLARLSSIIADNLFTVKEFA